VTVDPDEDGDETPRLELGRGVDYQRMRGLIESSLFGETAESLRIGRFTVLDTLGAGGMGVVYAAYDDVLDRKVAVKVLRGAATEQARERMLREARAMARLVHPNIVAVHEVGEHAEQVFLAMEFVRGRSLDRWIHEGDRPHPWREVVEVFRLAGRGLAAAHGAGLVHRDFKPHNVILGDDGAVKVLDFGLAFPTERSEPEIRGEAASPKSGPEAELSSVRALTRTGALVGTPAYMSPEQLRAEPATAASDQFAFCVSLFEALHGQRPFAGQRLEQLVASVFEGNVRDPPVASTVPAWVRAIVRRGLSLEPRDRFESLSALLHALDRDPAVARRRWLGGASIVAIAVAGSFGLAALQREDPTQPCEGVAVALDEIWSEPRRAAIQEGFLGSGVGYASDTWERVAPRLDAYASLWVEASTEACQAHARGRQSEAIFDLRTVCLDSRRASLDAVVQLLARADEGVAERAAEMVAGLPSLARCGDLPALSAALPPPDDPAQAQEVAGLREQLARAQVREDAGRADEAASIAAEVHVRAQALGYAPLRAEAALRLGSARQEARMSTESDAALSEAFFTAIEVGHDEVAIEALARRIYVRSALALQAEPPREDEPLGRALLGRVPDNASLRWLLANNVAVAYDLAGQAPRAQELYMEALEHARSRGDEGRLDASVVLTNLAYLALDSGDPSEGEAKARAALTLAEHVLGPEHPKISGHLYPLALALVRQGRDREARSTLERSVAIYESARQGPSVDIAQDLFLLAEIARVRRDYEEVGALARRGLSIVEEALGPDDAFLIRLRHALGHARVGQGEFVEGLAEHRRALALATKLVGPRGLALTSSYAALSEAYRQAKDLDAALEQLEKGLEIAKAAASEQAPLWAQHGELLLAAGRVEDARVSIERAIEIASEGGDPRPLELAPLRLRLGDMYARRGEWGQARSAYARALQTYEKTYDDDHPELARARGSLARASWRCLQPGLHCGQPDPGELERHALELANAATSTYRSLGERFEDEARELEAFGKR